MIIHDIENEIKSRLKSFNPPELLQLYSIETLYQYKIHKDNTLKDIELLKEQSHVLQHLITNDFIDGLNLDSKLLPHEKEEI